MQFENIILLDKPPECIGQANSLWTSIEILTVDSIDTIQMEVGLSFRVTIRWRDPRPHFSNILNAPFEKETVRKVLGIFRVNH